MGFHIDDPKTWQEVKKGKYLMFSIEGQGIREPLKKGRIAKTFSEIHKYNPYHDAKGRFARANGSKTVVVPTPKSVVKGTSLKKHIDPKTGKISKERKQLYDKIIKSHFEGVEKPTGRPNLEYMGGGGAAAAPLYGSALPGAWSFISRQTPDYTVRDRKKPSLSIT